MGDSTFLPLHLGFVGERVNQQMEIEGGLLASLAHERGKKRPPSPPTLSSDEDDCSLKSTSEDDDNDWLFSGSEEDEDHDNKRTYTPFTVDDIPRPTCDHKQQLDILYKNPDVKRRGPSPIQLFPAFRSGGHIFDPDYNLGDKAEISIGNLQDCSDKCRCWSTSLLQFIDVKLAGYRHSRPEGVKIYGFIAARETAEPLRNYVYKRGIRNCETVSVKQETGVARLTLTSPTRVISMPTRALIEFELHALIEDGNGDDENLIIEGCTEVDIFDQQGPESYIDHRRLYSDKCALDIKYAVLCCALEARVHIEVLRAPSQGVDLKLCAKTSGFSDIIRLFQGAALAVGFTTSFAVAVERRSSLDLYINGCTTYNHVLGQKPLQGSWQFSFSSGDFHGIVEQLAALGDFAEISVKVTWKSYDRREVNG